MSSAMQCTQKATTLVAVSAPIYCPRKLRHLHACTSTYLHRCVVAPKDPVTGVGQDEALKALNTGDTAWMLICAAIVLIMTPGKVTGAPCPHTTRAHTLSPHVRLRCTPVYACRPDNRARNVP